MKKLLLLIILVFFGVNSANATYIDFASDVFKYAHGQTEFFTDYYGFDVTVKAHDDSPSWHDWGNPNDYITWNPGPDGGVDGIGVNDDEISNNGGERDSEFLYISFNTEMYIDYVDITDLFYENDDFERGSYWLETSSPGPYTNWSSQKFFEQNNYSTSNGEFELSINSTVVGLWFSGIDYSPEHDYSVRGIEATAPVPEPATMLLFGTGLAGLAGYRRRKAKK